MLSGASSGNTGHLATNFYYRRERALLEAEMSERARQVNPDWLAGQPSVPWVKSGIIFLAKTSEDEMELSKMLHNAKLNKVSGVRKISLDEVTKLEPSLNLSGVTSALISEDEYIVDSWLLSMTHVYGMEVAGVEIMTNCKVTHVTSLDTGWYVETTRRPINADCVINCAGNFGDEVESLAKQNVNFKVTPGKGEYLIFRDINRGAVRGCVVPIPSKTTAGVYIFKSVYGQIVVGPTNVSQEDKYDRSVSVTSANNLLEHLQSLYPDIQASSFLGTYSGLRPATQHQDYCIQLNIGNGWVTVAGIRSTGLSNSLAISQYVAEALVSNYKPSKLPMMPTPEAAGNGQVKIGSKNYTVTHPLSKLGLVGDTLPQKIINSNL